MANNLRLFRGVILYKNGYKLFRRSKPHTDKEHWDETRLGEISVNWSFISSKPHLVKILPLQNNPHLYNPKYSEVLVFDTCSYPPEELPVKVISDNTGNKLEVYIEHDPLRFNYAHCNINCYLTTTDGEFTKSLVKAEDYQNHPLKKKLRGLRNEYKTLLAYWFQQRV